MRRAGALLLALVYVFALSGCAAILGSRPYKNLTAEEIASAEVCLSPPDKTVPVEDLEKLTALLRQAVVYEKDNSYTEYCGQGVDFRLTMRDGSQMSIVAFNPFLIIDGTGYRTKYEPCEALNQYANNLLNAEN